MPALATYSLTGNPYIDGVLGDAKWAVTDFTFSMPTSSSYYGKNYGSGEPGDNFAALNSTQKSVVYSTLAMYASVSKLTFSEVAETTSTHADLRFAMSDQPSTAWAYFPSTAPEGGDSWFNNSAGYYDNPAKGNYAYSTFVHETGHGLGLEHTHNDNVTPVDRNSLEYSVMSYRSFVGAPLSGGYSNETFGYPQSLMMYDIAALQHLYGADYTTNGGNTTYSWSPTTGEMFIDGAGQGAPGANRIFLTVWDGGGADTYDFSSFTTDLDVNLRPGQWTTTSTAQLAKLHYDGSEIATGNIANALLANGDERSLIENARGGTGDDAMTGNQADNKLWGGGGGDVLRGGGGDDDLFGQAGQDLLVGGAGADRLQGGGGDDSLAGGGGRDRVIGGGGNDAVVGGRGNDRLIGGQGDDLLKGGEGNDVLFGGPGGDVMIGGAGRDTFVFRSVDHSPSHEMDTIRFESGSDRINLRPIDADITLGGNQAFTFIDTDPFSHTAGELSFRGKVLSGDVDGDGTADFAIQFAGPSMPVESDFIL